MLQQSQSKGQSVRPGRRVGFTIAAVNGDNVAIGLSSVSDRLQKAFKYVKGSTTLNGRLVTDPKVKGRMWAAMSGTHDLPRPKMWRMSAPERVIPCSL
jgi:hypothetical protein